MYILFKLMSASWPWHYDDVAVLKNQNDLQLLYLRLCFLQTSYKQNNMNMRTCIHLSLYHIITKVITAYINMYKGPPSIVNNFHV